MSKNPLNSNIRKPQLGTCKNSLRNLPKFSKKSEIINQTSLKIYALNVGGLSTKFDLGLIDKIIEKYDIICLSETKTNFINNFTFPKFRVIEMPRKIKTH